jgi:hypothetical protein
MQGRSTKGKVCYAGDNLAPVAGRKELRSHGRFQGAHDDQVDAMTQALVRWHQPVDQTAIIPFSDLAAANARIREGSPGCAFNPV